MMSINNKLITREWSEDKGIYGLITNLINIFNLVKFDKMTWYLSKVESIECLVCFCGNQQ